MRIQASRCRNTFAFATAFFYITVQCNCGACNVPPDAGLQKRANSSTLIVGLAGTGDRARATCVSGIGNNCSAIYYDTVMISFLPQHEICLHFYTTAAAVSSSSVLLHACCLFPVRQFIMSGAGRSAFLLHADIQCGAACMHCKWESTTECDS
jgi:hypothetical protein